MALTKISTDGVKDDAVTAGKIPANAVGSSELADNSVDTNAIQDQAVALSKLPHGDSNNNGKFLRANNGADPSFETVSIPAGTTINNNADNRVITGSGSANTLNGEANLVFNGNELSIAHTNPQFKLTDTTNNTDAYLFSDDNGSIRLEADLNSEASDSRIRMATDGTERVSIDSNLKIFDGDLIIGTAGHGIDFSATANATMISGATAQMGQGYDPSTDSEILTHYEHGTWKPRLRAYDHTGGAAWGHMIYTDGSVVEGSGRYVRIGRYVFASFGFNSGSKTFDSNWTYWSIDTIPFGANHYDRASGGLIVSHTNAFTDTTNMISGDIHGPDAYMIGNRPSGEYNATINTSNSGRWIRGWCSFYTSTG